MTTELITHPYDLPRKWAAAFRVAGLGGIRHELRHGPRARPSGGALFGTAGQGTHDDGERVPLTADQVGRAGVDVFDPPRASNLAIVD